MSAALRSRRQHLRHQLKRPSSRRHFKIPALIIWTALVLAALAITTLTAWLIATRRVELLPKIARVECQTNTLASCPIQIQAVLNSFITKPLLFSALETELQTALLTQGYALQGYTRILPDKLALIIEPLPIGWAIVDEAGMPLAALALDGTTASILSIQDSTPRITVTSSQLAAQIGNGPVPDWLIPSSQELQRFASASATTITQASISSPFDLALSIEGQPYVYRLNPHELVLNLNRLSFILKSDLPTIVASSSGEVDIRFRVPVLRSAP